MKTNLLQKPLLYPNRMGGKPIGFTGANPLLKNQERFDEVELEKNLNTKEGQIAFLQYHLEKAKGSQGFIARGFNKLKSWTGLGLSSKKLDEEIAAFMAGQVPFEKVCQDINKFKYNQKEATDVLVDGVLMGTCFATQCTGNKFSTLVSAASKSAGFTVRGLTSFLVAGSIFAKPIIKFIDSFGMKKSERKENRTFGKDLLTGWTNTIGASFVANQAGNGYGKFIASGVGLAAVNSGIRYLTIPKEDKSFGDFMSQQIENPALKLTSLAALGAFGLFKCNKATKMQQAAKKLIPSNKLSETGVATANSPIRLVADETKLLQSQNIKNILLQDGGATQQVIEKRMEALERENIFIPKFLQTLSDDEDTLKVELKKVFGLNDAQIMQAGLIDIVQRFKSECTGARSQDEAQATLNEIFGDGKYKIIPKEDYMDKENIKPLGVGSVAETWKVQDSSGNKYAIKLLKKGMTKEKIAKDKEAMLKILKSSDAKDKEFCEKSLNELYQVWEQELDLDAEMKNGELLGQNITKARVAKGIEVKSSKDGVTAYVMELARGVQLSEYFELESLRTTLGCSKFGDNGVSLMASSSIAYMRYMQVVFEQLLSVPKTGEKVLHADPHPGNIFVEFEDGTGEPKFTFIDTGNVIKSSNKEALHNTILHLNYFLGNTDAIAKTHLDSANLNGKNKEECIKNLSKFLYDSFYCKNKLRSKMDIFAHIDALINNWMQNQGITPDPKLANLHKAEATYFANSRTLSLFAKMKEESKHESVAFYNQTIDQMQKNINIDMKFLDKIEYLLKAPSSQEWKKYNAILDTYFNLTDKIQYLQEEVNKNKNLCNQKVEISEYCKEKLALLQTKVKSLMDNLNEHINNQFGGEEKTDNISRRNITYSQICNKIFEKFNQDYLNENKYICLKNRENIYNEVKSEHSVDKAFDEYEKIKQEMDKQEKDIDIKAISEAGKSFATATGETLLGVVKTILKDIGLHLPSSCSELAQLNKFIDEHPDKAMQGLQTTLG